MESFRKAYAALKDSTKVGLAKVNSEFKEIDIAIVKATSHAHSPPKERHVRKIIFATSAMRPRADVAYCIHALSKRLSKTRSWIVAIKTLIVIHRTLREADPTFREELLNYSNRSSVLQISNFKDDSSPLAWDCSAWVRTYALFLEERLECFRILRYDIEAERLTKVTNGGAKVHSRTRLSSSEELLEQLPALQQLLYRLVSCQPEGVAINNSLIQYALALVLKESFKIYCAVNDGIINLVDMFFDMARHDAVKALIIYRRAGQQAETLADFYEFCRALSLARYFRFPTLRQPPPSFLTTMEEYIREAPRSGSSSSRRKELREQREPQPQKVEEPMPSQTIAEQVEKVADTAEEPNPKGEVESPPNISTTDTTDLLGLNELEPIAAQIEERNALSLAIVPPGNDSHSTNQGFQGFHGSNSSGWELALVNTPSNNATHLGQNKMGGGFDKLLLDSLYEDEAARRQLHMQNAGYGYNTAVQNPFYEQDPFSTSNSIAPPLNVQMAMMAQQHQQQMMFYQQQLQLQQYQQMQHHHMMMVPHQYLLQYQQQPMHQTSYTNPFGDPFLSHSPGRTLSTAPGNHILL